jgi:asparagine synthase (glutamine-hydrolysing)
MCGFTGTLTPRSINILSHRGPSGGGYSGTALPWAYVNVEMTRLAIVDQRPIPVPFDFTRSCGVLLAYNGEIYNWKQLRTELSDGTPWETDCDAEVIARAWRRWGVDCFSHFNGMFGIALIDLIENQVMLARDRAGEKPLYYRSQGGSLSFASEIKALSGDLKEGYCPELSVFEFDCLETTPFENVRCLGPGEFILLKSSQDLQRPQPQTWWQLPSDVSFGGSFEDAVEQLQFLLVDSIKLRADAEVPVAVQLSGGLDSSIVQAVARAEKMYTVTFPTDGVDCMEFAQHATAGMGDPVPVTFGYQDLVDALPQVIYHLDTPATWTAVCQWFMNKKIREDGSIVVLSGEGSDEIFGGYSRYRFLDHYTKAFSDSRLLAYGEVGQRALGSEEDVMAKMLDRSSGKHLDYAREVVRRFSKGQDLAAKMARVEFYTTMQCLLRMADRMSSAFGMENRSPFLDYRVMEFGASLPTKYKINKYSKAVVVEVARRLGVPPQIYDQETKRGLFVPWAKWTNGKGWDRSGFAEMAQRTWRQIFSL